MDKIQLIGYAAVIVIIITLANFGMRMTGKATDIGTVNVTIESTATINFTDDNINFGSGQVYANVTSATLESNSSDYTGGNWSWSTDTLDIENTGNVNVTIHLKADKNGSTMIGGTSPQFNYSAFDGEAGSCAANVTEGAWYDVNTTDPGTLICDILDENDNQDVVSIRVRLVIPNNAEAGAKGAIFTATGTGI